MEGSRQHDKNRGGLDDELQRSGYVKVEGTKGPDLGGLRAGMQIT
jgi:hypothetical protein